MSKVARYLRRFGVLLASLAIALSPVIEQAEEWADLVTTAGAARVLMVSAGVLLAWMGESPRKPSSRAPRG